jgi:hypothetical protein
VFWLRQKKQEKLADAEILHQNQDQLTQVIIYDVFTPPVAARIYVYSSLASYEAIRFSKKGAGSITEKLKGFGKMPQPEKGKEYDYTLAATKAFFTVVRNVKVFSVDSLKNYEESVYKSFQDKLDDSTYLRSVAFGDTIAKTILATAKKDGYAKSRGKPKHLGSNDAGRWRPTPPDYMDGVEWCWNTMATMVLDSSAQSWRPARRYIVQIEQCVYEGSKEVYTIGKGLTEEQKTIARYWDDNPFVMEHSGHMMFANKKITPGGHWMGIAAIAARQTKADPVRIAETYALTSIALYDAFIICWDEKYRSNVVRPVTVINELIDKNWHPSCKHLLSLNIPVVTVRSLHQQLQCSQNYMVINLRSRIPAICVISVCNGILILFLKQLQKHPSAGCMAEYIIATVLTRAQHKVKK